MKYNLPIQPKRHHVVAIVMMIIALLVCDNCHPVLAQSKVVRNGNTFTMETSKKQQVTETNLWFEVKERGTLNSTSYQIFLSAKGHAFIWRTSKNTGKSYKQYLPEEISKQASKEYGITYVPSPKKGN